MNANGVNLNVIAKHEYSLIFLYIVRNFAFMSDFRKLRWFLLVLLVFVSFVSFLVFALFVALSYNFFCWHGANKTQRPLSEFLFALFFIADV